MPTSNNVPELLAPAGNPAMLHAVVAAGADAAYLGMGELNARRSAENFDDETFAEACDYAHLRGSRVYVAMNTIVLPEEMPRALKTARRCVDAGADAFIVQDLGFAVALARTLPQAQLHASTQMSIHSKDGISALAELGFARVTLARELSLGEIAALCEHAAALGMEVETFAHGALCVCYSGQCLMSSLIGGRSANRGLCAQACRLPYRLVDLRDPKRQLKSPGEHLLSPKDLCLVDDVSQLAQAGVASLKIEGRMKSSEYAHTVVGVYREALDAASSEEGAGPDAREGFRSRLGSVFSRGFASAYFDGERGNDVMSYQRPNNRGQFVGRVKEAGSDFVEIACEKPLVAGDVLEVWTRRGNFTIKAHDAVKVSGKTVRLPIPEADGSRKGGHNGAAARSNDRVFRVRSADAAVEDDPREPRIPVAGSARLRIGQPLKVSFRLADDGSTVAKRLLARLAGGAFQVELEGDVVEAARTRAVVSDDVASHIDRLGQTPYRLVDMSIDLDEGVGIGFSQLHHIRTDALDLLTTEILKRIGQQDAIDASGCEGSENAQHTSEERASKRDSAGQEIGGKINPTDFAVRSQAREVRASDDESPLSAARVRIAVVATNPECARAAKRAGAHDILVPALNYRRGQSQWEGVLADGPTQAPFPKKCTIMVPAVAHDAEGESREARLGEDAWANVAEGQPVYVDSLGALLHARQLGCQVDVGLGLPLVNADALRLARAFDAARVWLSPELTLRQVADLASSADGAPRLGVKVAGAQELMVTEHCMLMSQGACAEVCPTCTRRRVPHALEDRKGYLFPVVTDALGRTHLYNSVELDNVPSVGDLLDAGVTDFMVDATLMSPEQCAQATGRLAKALEVWAADGNTLSKLPNTTTGHLHRGVM